MLGRMQGGGRETSDELTERDQPLDLRIARLADRQHGVVSLRQLEAEGLKGSAVRMRVAAGRLHRVHRGVFAVGRARLDVRGRRIAAVLACGRGAVISHRTAADALGIAPWGSAVVEITVPSRAPRRRHGLVVHRSPGLGEEDCADVDGVPCTNAARTLHDLAAVVGAATLARAIEAAERLRLFDRSALKQTRGPLQAALAAYTGDPSTRSEIERLALAIFAEAGLPRPAVNFLVETAAGPLEVDFCWPDRRLVAEADSFEFHGTRAAFERDRRRDQQLRAAGWTVVRVTWRQLNDSPGEVVAAIAA
jgi:hypothetical protein